MVEATSGARRNSDADAFLTGLSRRGPDGVGMWVRNRAHISDGIGSRTTKVHVGGSLLQLRGELPSATPLVDADGTSSVSTARYSTVSMVLVHEKMTRRFC